MIRSATPTRRVISKPAADKIDSTTIRGLCQKAGIYHKPLSFNFDTLISGHKYKLQSSSATIIHSPRDAKGVPPNTAFILNIRAVNYHLDEVGNIIPNDGRPDILTLNKVVYLDSHFDPLEEKWAPMTHRQVPYNGIEDIRLFVVPETGDVHYIGSYYRDTDQKICIVMGAVADLSAPQYIPRIITPAFETANNWEKNWVMFGGGGDPITDPLRIIYKWNPLQICAIEEDKLKLLSSHQMPPIFDKFRGSTNGVTYRGRRWFIVHFHHTSAIDGKRRYLHCWVVFNTDMGLLGYSQPFNFRNKAVEYCIGMIENNDNFILTYSTLDKTTDLVVIPVRTIATAIFGQAPARLD